MKRTAAVPFLLVMIFANAGCKSMFATFESPEAKLTQELADRATALDLVGKGVLDARALDVIGPEKFVKFEAYFLAVQKSITKAAEHIGKREFDKARAEMNGINQARNLLQAWLNANLAEAGIKLE